MNMQENFEKTNMNLFDFIIILIKSRKFIFIGMIISFLLTYAYNSLEEKTNDVNINFSLNENLIYQQTNNTIEQITGSVENLSYIFLDSLANEDLYLDLISNYENEDDLLESSSSIKVVDYDSKKVSGTIQFSGKLKPELKQKIIADLVKESNNIVKDSIVNKIQKIRLSLQSNVKYTLLKFDREIDRKEAQINFDIEFEKLKYKSDKKNLRKILEQHAEIARNMGFMDPALDQIAALYSLTDAELSTSLGDKNDSEVANLSEISNIINNRITKSNIINSRITKSIVPLYFYGVDLLELEIQNIDDNSAVEADFFTELNTQLKVINDSRNINFAPEEVHELILNIEILDEAINEIKKLKENDFLFNVNYSKFYIAHNSTSLTLKLLLFMPFAFFLLVVATIFYAELNRRKLRIKDL